MSGWRIYYGERMITEVKNNCSTWIGTPKVISKQISKENKRCLVGVNESPTDIKSPRSLPIVFESRKFIRFHYLSANEIKSDAERYSGVEPTAPQSHLGNHLATVLTRFRVSHFGDGRSGIHEFTNGHKSQWTGLCLMSLIILVNFVRWMQ